MYLIGVILKPHGIKGEVKIEPITPDPERFEALDEVYINNKHQTEVYLIEQVRFSGRFVYVKFEGIESRDAAEHIRDGEIFVDTEKLIKLKPNEFFIHDLIGCEVFDDSQRPIGKLIDIMQLSSNDIYVIKTEKGIEHLIPAIKDVIKNVDISNKRIIIHILDGMLD